MKKKLKELKAAPEKKIELIERVALADGTSRNGHAIEVTEREAVSLILAKKAKFRGLSVGDLGELKVITEKVEE